MTKKFAIYLLFLFKVLPVMSTDREALLVKLDKEVANSHNYVRLQEKEIERFKGYLSVSTNITDRYLSCKQLANAYAKFDSDSAFYYLSKCYDYGKKAKNIEWIQQALIKQAFIYADRGDKLISANRLGLIGGIDKVLPQLRADYANAVMMRHLNFRSYNSSQQNQQEEQNVWNTYKKYLKPNSLQYYFYYSGLLPQNNNRQLKAHLLALRKTIKPYSMDAALVDVLLYQVCSNLRQKDEAFEYLISSAIADIRCANRSSSSLVLIIEWLSKSADCYNQNDRLVKYTRLSATDITIYKDVGRSIKLIEAQNAINNDYIKINKRQHTTLLIVVVFLLLFLLITIYQLYRAYLRHQHARMALQQERKKEGYISLQTVRKDEIIASLRQKLSDAEMFMKNNDIVGAKTLTMVADLLKDIRAYKKDLARMLQAGMYREAKRMTAGAIAKDRAVEQFYTVFDDSFQTLHPDFVDRFNALLLPEFRFKKNENKVLMPEQRIYALISLGIEESVNIAEILQYSVQTVYNYRLKVRRNTLEPGFKVAEYVRNMYRIKEENSDTLKGE